MSKLITDIEEIRVLIRIMQNAVGENKLCDLQENARRRRYVWKGESFLIDFLVEVWGPVTSYVRGLSDGKLGEIVAFLQCEDQEIPQSFGSARPAVIYGVTGYKNRMHATLPNPDGRAMLEFWASWTLVCYAFDYIRQPLYHELWTRKVQETHAECGC